MPPKNLRLSSDDVRHKWLEFFKDNNHIVLEPSSLVPVDDKSLLWINSGIATLKPYFDGRLRPPHPNLTNCQRVLRTTDVENVGTTLRHNTFFEMLGNFSIGGYFKETAILYAWEFLTNAKWMGLDPKLLFITVYKEDTASYNIWRNKIKVANDHIIKGNKQQNWWEIGEGPCGPCTEIFYDRGSDYDPENKGLALLKNNIDSDRYLEIWNIVFSEFYSNNNGQYSNLPQKNIDTGAGLERLMCIAQQTASPFETDLFGPIIDRLAKLTDLRYDPSLPNSKETKAFRIIADHIRAVVMTIFDGVFPGNKGQSYVVRSLLRRAAIAGRRLNIDKPFLYKLVQVVIKTLKNFYPRLTSYAQTIEKTIQQEEITFASILTKGLKQWHKMIAQKNHLNALSVFRLHDTFGLPLSLIKESALENKIEYDDEAVNNLIQNHRRLSQKSQKYEERFAKNSQILAKCQVTSQPMYESCDKITDSKVVFVCDADKIVEKLVDQTGFIVLDKTPFYAEKGGQKGDRGLISGPHGTAQVLDVQIGPNGQYIHSVAVAGTITLQDVVTAEVDSDVRKYTRKNHSGTHILHAAIRNVLGPEAQQMGSFNDNERLRIDINFFGKITPAQVQLIEDEANAAIKKSIPCQIFYTDLDTAIHKYKALAFFGEKYEQQVRVVKFGDYSCELCGGTHCNNTAEIEDLLITGFESKGQNQYRFYALTSHWAIKNYAMQFIGRLQNLIAKEKAWILMKQKLMQDTSLLALITELENIAINHQNIAKAKQLYAQYQLTLATYRKKIIHIEEQKTLDQLSNLKIIPLASINLIIANLKNASFGALKSVSDQYQNLHSNLVILLYIHGKRSKYQFLISNSAGPSFSPRNIITNFLQAQIDPNTKGGGSDRFGQGSFQTSLKDEELEHQMIRWINDNSK